MENIIKGLLKERNHVIRNFTMIKSSYYIHGFYTNNRTQNGGTESNKFSYRKILASVTEPKNFRFLSSRNISRALRDNANNYSDRDYW